MLCILKLYIASVCIPAFSLSPPACWTTLRPACVISCLVCVSTVPHLNTDNRTCHYMSTLRACADVCARVCEGTFSYGSFLTLTIRECSLHLEKRATMYHHSYSKYTSLPLLTFLVYGLCYCLAELSRYNKDFATLHCDFGFTLLA